MAEEPVSLIEETIPSQGNPLSGMMEEQIDIEIEEEQPPEMEELDDGSVVLSYEEQAFKEAIFAEHDANIAELIDERELMEIASDLSAKYEEDKSGRKDWEESYVNGLDLLGN